MADQRDTGISWTDETWNPVVGCSIVSPACTNCYAMAMASRIENIDAKQRIRAYVNARHLDGIHPEGEDPARAKLLRPLTHYAGTTKVVNGKPVWTGKLARAPDHIVTAPLRWRRPRRVFVNSMSDLFHEDMPDEWIDEVFAVMALSPQHTFQILTKRPERMRTYLTRDWASAARFHVESLTLPTISKNAGDAQERLRRYTSPGFPHPLENVWLGVTAEDQARADERIPHLLSTPAAVRFVSAEPLLGPINLSIFMWPVHRWHDASFRSFDEAKAAGAPCGLKRQALVGAWCVFLDWVIVGGESGPGARPTHPDWIREIRDQCAEAGVAFHFKQWGEHAPQVEDRPEYSGKRFRMPPMGGGRLSEGPIMVTVGKARAGRTLDGQIHDAFPEARRG